MRTADRATAAAPSAANLETGLINALGTVIRVRVMSFRLVVLVSGSGTNLQALLDACADPSYGCTVVAVGADKPGVGGLTRAQAAGVGTFVVPFADYADRTAWDTAVAKAISAYEPDLVVCAGFMRVLGPAVVDAFAGRM